MFKVFNKFYTDTTTVPGAKVIWGRKFLPMVKEYYISRETRQKFKVFGIPMYLRTEIHTAHFPSEMMTLMDYLRDKDLATINTATLVNGYRELMLEQAGKAEDTLLKRVDEYDGPDNAKIYLMKAMKEASATVKATLTADVSKFTEVTDMFVKQGCVPLYTVGSGAHHRLYMVKLMHDTLVFYTIDVTGPLLNGVHIGRIETFHLTEQVIKAHNAHTDKKGVL